MIEDPILDTLPPQTPGEVRQEILGLARRYFDLISRKGVFSPGDDPVQVSGKVLDGDDLEMLIEASLDIG